MAIFQAFCALRPVPDKAAWVAALPYDVVTREEAKAIGDRNPDSFLHVDRAEMSIPGKQIFMIRRFMTKREKTLQIWKETELWYRTRHRATTFMN